RGAVEALLEALRQGELQELVHASEDRRERPAREPLVLLVEEAERDEVGGLELGLPALFGGGGLVLHERPVHPDDLERLLLQVVGLLDVEGEHLEAISGSTAGIAGTRSARSLSSTGRRWFPF